MSVHYKTYSIADLRDWLLHNVDNGLSHHVINRARAYAFINNPCAKDDDPVLVVVFDENLLPVGYTGVFAEDYSEGNVQGRFFWGSTEWLSPEYRGKGIASKMMDAAKQAVGYQNYLGLASSLASIKLDIRQGSKVNYYPQYRLVLKSTDSLKGKCATQYASVLNNRMKQRVNSFSYRNRFLNYVDDETYRFIRAHSGTDLFLRSQKMFNWLLQFPFGQICHDKRRLESDNYDFRNYVETYEMSAVQVRVNNALVGFYIVSQVERTCTLRYLYFDQCFSNEVFSSVSSFMIRPEISEIRFFGKELYVFLREHGFRSLNTKDICRQISFTTPGDFEYDQNLDLQGGDGDMLT